MKGFSSERDEMTEEMKQACEAAAGADVVVIFAGLPDSFESEGYDRTSMELPKCQNRLIEAVAEIQKNVVVVLHNGSPVESPWAESVNAILEMYLGGEGIGEPPATGCYLGRQIQEDVWRRRSHIVWKTTRVT